MLVQHHNRCKTQPFYAREHAHAILMWYGPPECTPLAWTKDGGEPEWEEDKKEEEKEKEEDTS